MFNVYESRSNQLPLLASLMHMDLVGWIILFGSLKAGKQCGLVLKV